MAGMNADRRRARASWHAVSAHLFNFVFPPRCAGCDSLMPNDAEYRICASCLATIRPPAAPLCYCCGVPLGTAASSEQRCARCLREPPSFHQARALACYDSSADDSADLLGSILRRHKYGPNQSLAPALIQLLEAQPPIGGDCQRVLPVPLHPRRLRWRGFNQSALFAAAVARKLALPLDIATLARVIPTTPQTAQDLASRRRNVHNAFVVKYPQRVAGRKLLLVDDVLTTGATVDECARMLIRAGAREIDVLTIARAL